MKRTLTALVAILLVFATVFSLASCNTVPKEGLWENATYRADTTLGKGAKTFSLIVEAGEQSVTFTVKTDEEMLDKALLGVELIQGEDSQYGLTVITVNGIDAVWERDNAYWAIYIGEDYAPVGISSIEVESGATYKLVWAQM